MQFLCNQDELMAGLQTATRAISARTTMPILEGALLEAEGDHLRITCSDLQLGIITELPARVVDEGNIVLPGKLLTEIVRKLPQGELNIAVSGNNAATLRCQGSRTTLSGFPAIEYPELPQLTQESRAELPQDILRDMIRQTSFSIAADETRPVLTGCLLEVEQGMVRLVALDGFRLALRQMEIADTGAALSAIIPGKSLNEISRILDDEGNVTLSMDKSHVKFTIGDTTVITRLLEGEYIKYKQILPSTWQTRLRVNKPELEQCIDRASLLARDGRTNLLKFEIDGPRLIITSNSELGDAHEELAVELEGPPLQICFNVKFLSDIMRAIDDDSVYMRFNSNVSPCLFCPVEDEQYLYLVLPVRSL